jgi:hypothetical protein
MISVYLIKNIDMLKRFGMNANAKHSKAIIIFISKLIPYYYVRCLKNLEKNTCLKTYKLNPAHYFTAPGLSFDALSKIT